MNMATTQTQDTWTNSHEPNIKEKMTQKLRAQKERGTRERKLLKIYKSKSNYILNG